VVEGIAPEKSEKEVIQAESGRESDMGNKRTRKSNEQRKFAKKRERKATLRNG